MRQEFENDYVGVFKFNFWHREKWVEIIIDDRLPCRNGNLIFTRSSSGNEFWSALLEKVILK